LIPWIPAFAGMSCFGVMQKAHTYSDLYLTKGT